MRRGGLGYGTGGASRSSSISARGPGNTLSTRQPQGIVTINIRVSDKESKNRAEWQIGGKIPTLGTYSNDEQLHIKQGDLIFTPNPDAHLVKTKLPVEARQAGFVSFNGYPLLGSKTQEEFQQLFKFVGIAKIPYLYGTIDQPKSGISVDHKGATSTPNTGTDAFSPGDRVAMVVPSPDPAYRSKFMAESAKFKHIDRSRLHAVPKRATYADAAKVPERAMAMLFSPGRARNAGALSLKRIRAAHKVNMSQLEHFALSMKRQSSQNAWNTIAVLSLYGLVTLNMPSAAALNAARSLDETLLKKSVADLLSQDNFRATVQIDQASGSARANLSDNFDAQAKELRKQQLLWLALKLDLIHDDVTPESQRVAPSTNLVDACVATNFAAFFNNAGNARVVDARRFLQPGVDKTKVGSVSLGAGSKARYAKDTYAVQLAKSQMEAPRAFYRSAIEAKNSVDSTVGAIALNASKPGTMLDVLM